MSERKSDVDFLIELLEEWTMDEPTTVTIEDRRSDHAKLREALGVIKGLKYSLDHLLTPTP